MEPGSPDWVRAGVVQLRDEVMLFVRTLWGFLRHPRLFTRGFLRGEVRALNPFGYLFTAIGVIGVAQAVFLALVPAEADDRSLLRQALSAALPPIYYVVLGLLTHAVLWLLGSRRPLVRDTAAVALYASGPAYLCYALVVLVAGTLRNRGASHLTWQLTIGPLGLGSLLAFAVPFVAALREIHAFERAAWARCILAFTLVFALSGLFFGVAHPPGSYGLHPTIGPRHGRWVVFFGD